LIIHVYQGPGLQEGQKVRLSDLLERDRPVVLNFWGALCPPCREELPVFQELHESYSERITFLALDVGAYTGFGTSGDARRVLDRLGITFAAGTSPDSGAMADYRVMGIPTTIFINGDGEIVARWAGPLSRDRLAQLLVETLPSSPE
jgi:thiol-disulfide isomerase/thioredoxin